MERAETEEESASGHRIIGRPSQRVRPKPAFEQLEQTDRRARKVSDMFFTGYRAVLENKGFNNIHGDPLK